MTKIEIDIREIKEDLKDIKNTLAKMQEDIKRIESNIPFYPTTCQHSPECFKDYDNWQSCSNTPTQACSEEELLKLCNK